MIKADLHIHSNINKRLGYFPLFYDSVQTVEQIISRALISNIKIISITDHDSLAGFYEAQNIIDKSNLELMLLPGCEVSSHDGHILAYNIYKEIKQGMSAQETIEAIHEQNGIAVAAHPFSFNSIKNKVYQLELDALEGYNATASAYANLKTFLAACYLKIPNIAGSDAHQVQEVGRSYMEFPDNTPTVTDLLQKIVTGDFKVCFSKSNFFQVLMCHIYENTRIQFRQLITSSNLWSKSLPDKKVFGGETDVSSAAIN